MCVELFAIFLLQHVTMRIGKRDSFGQPNFFRVCSILSYFFFFGFVTKRKDDLLLVSLQSFSIGFHS